MAIKLKSGIVLRNPSEKAKRYARQMKSGFVRETGQELSATDMAYRAGYLDARKDSAKCYNAQIAKKKKRAVSKKRKTVKRAKKK